MRESDTLELKRQFVNDLNKEVIAFANTNGGEIFIGIDDNGDVVGVNDIEALELQCINHVLNSVKPDLSMFVKFDRLQIEEKDVLKITVGKGSLCPYYVASKGIRPEGVYIRRGTASVPASESAILSMIKETSGDSYEASRSMNQDLTFFQAQAEFEKASVSFAEAQKRSLGIIGGDGLYTNLALLLSDQCVHKIKFAVFEGEDKEIFKDRHEFSGSLFRQLEDLMSMIDKHNRLSSPKIQGVKRIDIRDYPEDAIRETLLNAIIHRDYGPGGYTLVSLFSDRIEVLSLGGLVRGVEMDDIMLGVSYLRNRRLAEVFYRLHFVEAYGTGISKIKKTYEKYSVKPHFECSSHAFKVTLPKLAFNKSISANKNVALSDSSELYLKKSKSAGRGNSGFADTVFETLKPYGNVNENYVQTEKEELVLRMLHEKKMISRIEVEKLLNVSSSGATRLLTSMVQKNKIKRIGKARNIRYVL